MSGLVFKLLLGLAILLEYWLLWELRRVTPTALERVDGERGGETDDTEGWTQCGIWIGGFSPDREPDLVVQCRTAMHVIGFVEAARKYADQGADVTVGQWRG